jgi:hypothetical protein
MGVASKEVGILAPLIAPAVILLRLANAENERISWALIKSIVLHCLPFIVASVIYYIVYVLNKGVGSSVSGYSTVPLFSQLWKINQFILVALNTPYAASINAWMQWATGSYDTVGGNVRIALYAIALLISCYFIMKRQFRSVMVFASLFVCLVVPLGLFHVHPHHTFPAVIVVALGVAASFSWIGERLARVKTFEMHALSPVLFGLLLVLSVTLMYRAYNYNTHVLSSGIHGFELNYNTSLYHDRVFKELAQEKASYVLIEECPNAWAVGSSAGVIRYFGHSAESLGEEYVKRNSMATKGFSKKVEIERGGGQIIGIECRPESRPPYKVVKY